MDTLKLEEKSVMELKALAYDFIAQRELYTNLLSQVNGELEKRFADATKTASIPTPVSAPTDSN